MLMSMATSVAHGPQSGLQLRGWRLPPFIREGFEKDEMAL